MKNIKKALLKTVLTALTVFSLFECSGVKSLAYRKPSCEDKGKDDASYTIEITGNPYLENDGGANGTEYTETAVCSLCGARRIVVHTYLDGNGKVVYDVTKEDSGNGRPCNCSYDNMGSDIPAVGHIKGVFPYGYDKYATKKTISGKNYYVVKTSNADMLNYHVTQCTREEDGQACGCGHKYEPASGTKWVTDLTKAKKTAHTWVTTNMPTGYTKGYKRCSKCNLIVSDSVKLTLTYSYKTKTDSKDAEDTKTPIPFTILNFNDTKLKNAPNNGVGYTFAGWADSATGKVSHSVGSTYKISKDTTIYAIWNPNVYTLTFKGNGNTSGSMSNTSFTYDKSQNLPKNGFVRAFNVTLDYNYDSKKEVKTATAGFVNWTCSKNSQKYNDQNAILNLTATNGETITMTANWSDATISAPGKRKVAIHEA